VYVRPIGGTGLPRQIAKAGNFPVWRGDGKEILFFDLSQRTISSVSVGGFAKNIQFSKPQPLFTVKIPDGLGSASRPLAVDRDGSRIYFLQSTEQPDSGVINVRTGAVR
jgi:hypothetical protein